MSKIRDAIADMDKDALFLDGFDDAIVGTVHRCGQPLIVAYSYELIVKNLMRDMSEEEAVEWVDFNMGAWVGNRTPAIVHPIDPDLLEKEEKSDCDQN